MFTREDGTAYQPNSVSDRFDRLVERTGLPRIRLHDRRHTSASIGLASGETLKEISERLGHATLSLTADTYTHVLPAVAHESAQRRARAIPRAAAQNPPLATPARPTHDPAATPQHQVRELGRE